MMWYVFKDTVWGDFWIDVKSMDYRWFGYSAILMITSHFIRALRWKQLIMSNGYNPSTKNVFASVLFMYVSNLVIPRSGELARCGTIYKYEKIPIPLLIGTVLIERLTDLISLLTITLFVLYLRFDIVSKMYTKTALPELMQSIAQNSNTISALIIITALVIVSVVIFRKKIKNASIFKKIIPFIYDLKQSFSKLLHLKHKSIYFLYTIIIWICYVGMFYVCVFAFKPTENIDLSSGLTAFIAGSYGMVAPTPGGVGVWPAIVSMALQVLGVAESYANSWAGVSFILMTITTAAAGVLGFMALPFINKDK